MSEAIVLGLGVHRDFAHCYANVYSINTLIRVKSASYCDHNRNYSFINNLYLVNTLTLDFYDY